MKGQAASLAPSNTSKLEFSIGCEMAEEGGEGKLVGKAAVCPPHPCSQQCYIANISLIAHQLTIFALLVRS